MKILIAGSSGLVGKALVPFLKSKGHTVYRLVRGPSQEEKLEISWDVENGKVDLNKLEGFDAVINLAGENIADSRWSAEKKEKILSSRILATRLLVDSFAKLQRPPKVLINASAIGFYGHRKDAVLKEESAPGDGFLADVCKKWEEESKKAENYGIRTVQLRIGAVLSQNGGLLAKMLLPFKLCLGGKLGSGRAWMSWIHIDDLIAIILLCLEDNSLKGPVNAVSPDAVTNSEFTKVLAETLGRPAFLPVPKFAVRLLFGQMGDELVLASTCVEPKKLKSANFKFAHPTLQDALKACV